MFSLMTQFIEEHYQKGTVCDKEAHGSQEYGVQHFTSPENPKSEDLPISGKLMFNPLVKYR